MVTFVFTGGTSSTFKEFCGENLKDETEKKKFLLLHVDEEQFLRHLMHDAFYSEKIESLAMAIYEHNKSIEDLNCIMTWHELSEEFKNSIRNQAKNIPNALLKINIERLKFMCYCETEL